MNKLVQVALKKPYTFVVLAILILVFGAMAAEEAPTDVFPVIQIPVSSVVWIYDNLMPADVEGRITYVFERFLTQTVEGIKYIWSNSLFGNAIINVYLQDGVDLGGSEADITAIGQTSVKALPPDINAPMIMRLFPSQVPGPPCKLPPILTHRQSSITSASCESDPSWSRYRARSCRIPTGARTCRS